MPLTITFYASTVTFYASTVTFYASNYNFLCLNKEAIEKFAPNTKKVISENGKKVIYCNQQTGVRVVYDKKGRYFRIKDRQNYHLNWDGERVHFLKGMYGKESSSYFQKNTHFNDIN